MVQDGKFKKLAHYHQLAGEADVHLRGFEVAAGVVMCQDQCAGITFERNLEDTFGIRHCTRDATFGELVISQDPVGTTQQQQVEAFDMLELVIPYAHQIVVCIFGAGQRLEFRGFDLVTVAYLNFS